MVVLDIAAPILLMFGITMTNSANVSLLNNFEIVATSIIALVIFKEVVSKRLWIAILLVTVASAILTFEGEVSFVFNKGSLFVLGACLCWGFENNCTKMISNKSSIEIVVIKGTFSGLGSLIVALLIGEKIPSLQWILCVILLGFVAYGLSIHFYIMAQKNLGAAKTSAYYSVAPFLGVIFSLIILNERPSIQFYVALAIMIISTGMYISIALKSTPLTKEAWGLSNQMTARALDAIGKNGGPRCCKRDSYLAIIEAVKFTEEKIGIKMETDSIICSRSHLNNQCIQSECPFNNSTNSN